MKYLLSRKEIYRTLRCLRDVKADNEQKTPEKKERKALLCNMSFLSVQYICLAFGLCFVLFYLFLSTFLSLF